MLAPLPVSAADIIKIEPYISIQEEFSDNINLTNTDKESDFITSVSPGIRMSTVGQTSALNLDYRLGLNFFAHNSENNYTSHSADLNGHYSPNARTTFRIRDYYVRSDDTMERQYLTGVQNGGSLSSNRDRSIFWRNVLEPGIEYKFGPEDIIALNFRDNVYRNGNPISEDSREDYINPLMTFWFNQRHGMTTEYSFTRGNFERSADLDGHMARGRYMFRPEPGKLFFGEYQFLRRNFDEPQPDYDVHNPSIGTQYAFTPTLSAVFQIGYYWYQPERGKSEGGPTGELSLIKRLIDTTLALSARWGYFENYFTFENLGFSKYYGVFGNITHQWSPRTTLGANTSMEWADYITNRTDRIWTTGANISYQPLRWLTLSFEALHRENTSDIDLFEYKENRIMIRMTAVYLKE